MCESTNHAPGREVVVCLPYEVLRRQNRVMSQGLDAYDVSGDSQYVDKRPFGPPARTDCLVDNPGDCYGSLADDNQRKETHSHVKVSILKTNSGSNARQPHHDPHLQSKQRKPNGPDVRPVLVAFQEGKVHLPKYQDTLPFNSFCCLGGLPLGKPSSK